MEFLTQESDFKLIDAGIQCLYFYASWMVFHNKMMTMIAKMEEKYKDISFLAIDVEEFKKMCKRFDVQSVPQVLIFDGGKEINRINGIVLTSAFKSVFADIYSK